MGNRITNGAFDSGISGWTVTYGQWQGSLGDPYPGCVDSYYQPVAGEVSQSSISLPTAGIYVITCRLRQHGMSPTSDCVWVSVDGGDYLNEGLKLQEDHWYRYIWKMNRGIDTTSIKFEPLQIGGHMYVDSVGIFLDTGLELLSLVEELRRRRRDPASLLHTEARYEAALNQALRDAPMKLWQPQVDVSVSTVADQRRYALSLTGLTQPNQIRRVWMDDLDDYDLPLGRWQVEDDGGTLTLVLDEDPPEAGRVLSIEYLAPFSELVYAWDSPAVDKNWLLARAMSLLLLDADPDLEDPAYIGQQLTYWDALRQNREREILNQTPRPAQTFRSTPWGNYVK